MAPLTPPSSDIIYSRATVALAQSQRLIASWLPPHSHSHTRLAADSSAISTKTEAETEELDDEIFHPAPELLGFGATVPRNGEGGREEMVGNEKLRKQLLGADYLKKLARGKREGGRVGAGTGGRGSKPRPAPAHARREVHGASDGGSEDDEGGRSSLGKSKLPARKRSMELERDRVEDDVVKEAEKRAVDGAKARSEAPKRAGNYLDEVLADRSRKRRKKSKRKGEDVKS